MLSWQGKAACTRDAADFQKRVFCFFAFFFFFLSFFLRFQQQKNNSKTVMFWLFPSISHQKANINSLLQIWKWFRHDLSIKTCTVRQGQRLQVTLHCRLLSCSVPKRFADIANKRTSISLWFQMRWGGKEMAIYHIFLSISWGNVLHK